MVNPFPVDWQLKHIQMHQNISQSIKIQLVRRKGKERKGRVFIQRLLYTMYISKRSGMDHKVLPANTPCLPFLCKRSPDGATSNWRKSYTIAAYYSSVDPEWMKGWVGVVDWPIADVFIGRWLLLNVQLTASKQPRQMSTCSISQLLLTAISDSVRSLLCQCCLSDSARQTLSQLEFNIPFSTNMAISETKGQEWTGELSYPVKEGQWYINLNPGSLFVQQPPKKERDQEAHLNYYLSSCNW